ncbi:isoprenoid synthase domain-containing protein [Bisporella sp. PMI_857]|nr:isoprenoid synthase domain-containing protein [Bisporella sp. PMI_857]
MALSIASPANLPLSVSGYSRDGDHVSTNRVTVTIPNLFVSFLANQPKLNPNYEVVRGESVSWIQRMCDLDEQMTRKISKTDFSFFMAIVAPSADVTSLRTLCDWGNWVFPYDDMFDNENLKNEPKKAMDTMRSLLSIMHANENEATIDQAGRMSIIKVHDTIWARLKRKSPFGRRRPTEPELDSFAYIFLGVQRRFAETMTSYALGALQHVNDGFDGRVVSPEEMLSTRRQSAGVTPLFALIEYANKLTIPDYIFEHESIKQIEAISTDIVVLQNDVLSYYKEESEGVPYNVLVACRLAGQSAQEAFDTVGALLEKRYQDLDHALAGLPRWGEPIDTDIQRYIQGIQNIAVANVHWSFRSARYFGKMSEAVRQTRKLSVLAAPELSRHYLSTDNRDKILALLGICEDGAELVPEEIGYQYPAEIIAANITKALIQKTGYLDFILINSKYEVTQSEGTLPTWTPDWVSPKIPSYIYLQAKRPRKAQRVLSSAELPIGSGILRVQGAIIGKY